MRKFLIALLFPVILNGQYTSIDGFAHGFYSFLQTRDSVHYLVFMPDSVEMREVVDSSLALMFRKVPNRKPLTPEFRASLYDEGYKDLVDKTLLWYGTTRGISDSLLALDPDTAHWKLQKIKVDSIPVREGSMQMAALRITVRLGGLERRIELPILSLGNVPKRWRLLGAPRFVN